MDINKGCPRLKAIKGYTLVHQCICAEDEEVSRILKVAKIEAAKSVAKQRLNKAIAARNNKRAAKLRQREKDTAKHVAQEIVYNNLQKSGSLNQALRGVKATRVKPSCCGPCFTDGKMRQKQQQKWRIKEVRVQTKKSIANLLLAVLVLI